MVEVIAVVQLWELRSSLAGAERDCNRFALTSMETAKLTSLTWFRPREDRARLMRF